jgi:hypothetical protein
MRGWAEKIGGDAIPDLHSLSSIGSTEARVAYRLRLLGDLPTEKIVRAQAVWYT